MARRVHGERSVGLLYGQRALLIGALEPLTYTGTMLSTRSGDRPFERLARTAKIQETVFLGTREEADKALAAVHRLHERIKGELPEAAGAHSAGAPYSAFDPELMLWTLAVIADSGREMYETMVRPLSEAEREELWQDYVRFGELFGLPRSEVPGELPRVPRLVRRRLASPDLHATEHALEMAPLVAFEPAGAGGGPRQPRGPEPHHQGHAAAAGARDLRHPPGPAPTSAASARSPPPTAAPAASSRARCAAAATTSSSTSSPGRAAARRHPYAAAQHRRVLKERPGPGPTGSSAA